MKNILVLICLFFILISCSDVENNKNIQNSTTNNVSKSRGKSNETGNSKKLNDFFIETKTISDFDNINSIQKVGKIVPNEKIDIKSQVTGKISNIYVKEGQSVYKGQTIANIEDTYSKYYLDLEKAEIDLEKQIINKESQILSLDKKIEDSALALDDAKKNYENAKITAAADIKKAKLDFENSNLTFSNSQAYLELEKAKLDYENIIKKNEQSIISYIETIKKEYNNLYLNIVDIIQFSDELLGITEENKDYNNSFDDFLGAKDSSTKVEAKNNLKELMNYEVEMLSLDINNLNEENLLNFMDSFSDGYSIVTTLLDSLEKTLNNSISSEGSLSQNDINNYISKVNGYQSSNQGDYSSFTSTRNSVVTFLNTYKDSELSSLKNIELQEKKLKDSSQTGEVSYEKTLVNIENTLNSYESKFKQAQLAYDNSIKNKEVTIKSLDNAITSAENNKNKTAAEYSKLKITSPIDGIISSIDIDNNSDVSNGTKLFSVISNNDTKIEVSLNSSEIQKVNIGDKVKVEYSGEEFYGEVYSKTSLANQNLEYKVLIVLDKKIDLVGGSAIVSFNGSSNITTIPFDLVTVTGDNVGTINIFEKGELKTQELSLGKIEGSKVEIFTNIPVETQIITTDLKNFNQMNQVLKVSNKQ